MNHLPIDVQDVKRALFAKFAILNDTIHPERVSLTQKGPLPVNEGDHHTNQSRGDTNKPIEDQKFLLYVQATTRSLIGLRP